MTASEHNSLHNSLKKEYLSQKMKEIRSKRFWSSKKVN